MNRAHLAHADSGNRASSNSSSSHKSDTASLSQSEQVPHRRTSQDVEQGPDADHTRMMTKVVLLAAVAVVTSGCWGSTQRAVMASAQPIQATVERASTELSGKRVTIEHEFLIKPISVQSEAELDVNTATNSIMLTTVVVNRGDGAIMMLTADGKPNDGTISALGIGQTLVRQGRDERIAWRIERTADGALGVFADSLETGVYCFLSEPDEPTADQIDAAIEHCRDIRLARASEMVPEIPARKFRRR